MPQSSYPLSSLVRRETKEVRRSTQGVTHVFPEDVLRSMLLVLVQDVNLPGNLTRETSFLGQAGSAVIPKQEDRRVKKMLGQEIVFKQQQQCFTTASIFNDRGPDARPIQTWNNVAVTIGAERSLRLVVRTVAQDASWRILNGIGIPFWSRLVQLTAQRSCSPRVDAFT
jgi:hypothetical protein